MIADLECAEIAASLLAELRDVGANPNTFILEDFGPRPHKNMPRSILDALETTDVSIYCVRPQEGEIVTRGEMLGIVERRGVLHAHMVYITKQIMMQGMRADFHLVDAISRKVLDLAAKTRRIIGETPAGTYIEVDFSPDLRWLKTSGLITREKWANLPGGEVLTSPIDVNGVYVVDAVVGDYLCQRYGDLKGTPLRLTIEHGRLVDAQCSRSDLLKDFLDYVATDENSNRVGEFAIGTNIGIREPIGNILQDEKLPGIHIAFGNPYPKHTGASWWSSTHIDVVARRWTITLDDRKIMENGQFLIAD